MSDRTVLFVGTRCRCRPSVQVGRHTRSWWVCRPGSQWWYLTYWPFWGWQVVWSGPERFAFSPSRTRPSLKRYAMKKPAAKPPGSGPNHVAAVETEMWSGVMALVEHCTVTRYDDGTRRDPGYLTIRTMGAAWVVDVKDPASCMSFRVVGEGLDEALEEAALLLMCESPPWERDPWLEGKEGRKKK